MQTSLLCLHKMTEKTGIQEAVDKFDGSPTSLATAAGNGILRQHVEHWLKAGRVPAEKCPDIYLVTGVSCERLNDKTNWDAVRNGKPARVKAEA